MNMGPSPTMYQPNPNVAPMSGAQFIPGKIIKHFFSLLRIN